MTLSPRLRKATLAVHLTVSIGWIGAVVAFLALVAMAELTEDDQTLRSAWVGMDHIGRSVLVPLSISALITGVVLSVGTKWGLFRHYWVVISLFLTLIATVVLLEHMQTVGHFSAIAAENDAADVLELRGALEGEILHGGGGLIVLIVVQVLNVFKPAGLTAYGWRKQQARRPVSSGPAGSSVDAGS